MPDYVEIFEQKTDLIEQMAAEKVYQDERVALKILEARVSELRKKVRTESLSEEDWLRIRIALVAVLMPEPELYGVVPLLSREVTQLNERLARVGALEEVNEAMGSQRLQDPPNLDNLGRRHDRLLADLGREWTDRWPEAAPSGNETQESPREDEDFRGEILPRESLPQRDISTLASIIRTLRTALGYTQQQFAMRMGLSVPTIARYEGNSSSPTRKILANFAALAQERNMPEYVRAFKVRLGVRFTSEQAHGHEKIAIGTLDKGIFLLRYRFLTDKVSAQESLRIRIALLAAILPEPQLSVLGELLSCDILHVDETVTRIASAPDANDGNVSPDSSTDMEKVDDQRRIQMLKAELHCWAQNWPPRGQPDSRKSCSENSLTRQAEEGGI